MRPSERPENGTFHGTDLHSLGFQGEKLTDQSLATLATIRSFRMVGLTSPAITDGGLSKLAAYPTSSN